MAGAFLLRQAAAAGHAASCNTLVDIFYSDQMLSVLAGIDSAEADALLARSAQLGDPQATLISMILMSEDPTVGCDAVRQPSEIALRWLREQAKRGDADFQFLLARALDEGLFGASIDKAQAAHWFGMAARNGHSYSQLLYGMILCDGSQGVAQDIIAGVDLLERAAASGDAEIIVDVGHIFWTEDAVRDRVRAVSYFRVAAAQGDATAMTFIAQAYFNGDGGVSRDTVEAVNWLKRAVACDDPNMATVATLGICFLRGVGTAIDEAEGFALLRRAAAGGDETARLALRAYSVMAAA